MGINAEIKRMWRLLEGLVSINLAFTLIVIKIITIQTVASRASFNAIAISFSSESSVLLPGACLLGEAKGARLKLKNNITKMRRLF